MDYALVMLLAYALVMLLATVIMTKKENDIEQFCVGSRNASCGVSALSIAATWIWAPALFTSAENAYTKGFAGLFWFLVPNVLCLIFFIPFAKRIREEMPEGISLSGHMYRKYHSEAIKNIYMFQLGMLSILSTGVQLLAGSKILSMLTGIPFAVMTVVMAAIAYSYSQFSGIKASMLTDAIQMAFMLAVSVCFMFFGINNGRGFEMLSTLRWVSRSQVKPNSYNPNKVSKQNLELLKQSILANGWTLPIVVRPDFTIIDGFHRWTVAGEEPLNSMLEDKVPIVIVEHKDKAGNIYGTVTHNRARGTHLLEPMKVIVKELINEGKSVKEIGKQLGMKPEEVFRLSDFSKDDFLKMMAKSEQAFSKAEFITKI